MATTHYRDLPRGRGFFRDRDGIPVIVHHPDEVNSYVVDWTDELGSETISTSAWTASGVTVSSAAISGTTTTANIKATGSVENKITTSGGRTLVQLLRFREGPRREIEDY